MENSALTRWDALKILALILMFVDHAGAFYYTDAQWLRGIGRACAPLFLFLAGFAPRYKFDKLLLVFAVALTVSDWLVAGQPNILNILWSIILLRILLGWLERKEHYQLRLHEWFIAMVPFIFILPLIQYGPFIILFGIAGYAFKHRARYAAHTPRNFLFATTIYYGVIYVWLSQFTWLTALVMAPSLMGIVAAILWFTRAPRETTGMIVPGGKWAARHTALIYTAHLIVLGWLTGKPL